MFCRQTREADATEQPLVALQQRKYPTAARRRKRTLQSYAAKICFEPNPVILISCCTRTQKKACRSCIEHDAVEDQVKPDITFIPTIVPS